MNVARLELCQELSDLSGWKKTQNVYAIATGEENKNVSPWLRIGVGSSSAWEEWPAYDLGYLLRKLPAATHIYHSEPQFSSWVAENNHVMPNQFLLADTPENALAKLAICLLKQGILKKEAA